MPPRAEGPSACNASFSAVNRPNVHSTPDPIHGSALEIRASAAYFEGMKQTKKSPPARLKPEVSMRMLRSAITNGSELLAGVDHRSARMRRLGDLIAGHVADLGGRDLISEAEYSIVRRCSLLTLELELLEARFEANEGAKASELDCYQRVSSTLRRLHEALGFKRRARDVTPSLGDLLRAEA